MDICPMRFVSTHLHYPPYLPPRKGYHLQVSTVPPGPCHLALQLNCSLSQGPNRFPMDTYVRPFRVRPSPTRPRLAGDRFSSSRFSRSTSHRRQRHRSRKSEPQDDPPFPLGRRRPPILPVGDV